MNMKILIDMNLSPDWVPLRRVALVTVGDPKATDRTIIIGPSQWYIVFTTWISGIILAEPQDRPQRCSRGQEISPTAWKPGDRRDRRA